MSVAVAAPFFDVSLGVYETGTDLRGVRMFVAIGGSEIEADL